MSVTAYLDCFSGISGDMFLGALLGAGLPETVLRQNLQQLRLQGWQLAIRQVQYSGIAAWSVHIECEQKQPCRHLADIEAIIEKAELEEIVREQALGVFRRLARAEAQVHGCDIGSVHFHELGALDCLLDVVGTVAGLHWLGVERLICSPLPMPAGWVRCSHGEIPLPAPAVCALLEDAVVYGVQLEQELVTPTGAALVRELADGFGSMPRLTIKRTGYGAGSCQRQDGRPNLLRLILGQGFVSREVQEVEIIETNLDDMNPEFWPHVCDRLLELHALDASLVPIQMKKGRPGFLLRVICDPAHGLAIRECILKETTAIGVRSHTMERMTLPRRRITVRTDWGRVEAKEILTPAGPVVTPEYESCLALARRHRIPLRRIYQQVSAATNHREDQQRTWTDYSCG